MKNKRNAAHTLCTLALLTAVMVLLTMTVSIKTPYFKLTLGSLPVVLAALLFGPLEGALVAGMILTRGTDKTYSGAPWRVDAPDEKTAVIHTLGVSPALAGRGLALEMIRSAVDLARERGWRALRLDVLDANKPAHQLYLRAGFQYICTKKIFYESVGLADFLLYEYAV